MGRDVDVTLTRIAYLKMETVITVASVDRIRCPKAEGIRFRNCQTGLQILQVAFFSRIKYLFSSGHGPRLEHWEFKSDQNLRNGDWSTGLKSLSWNLHSTGMLENMSGTIRYVSIYTYVIQSNID